MAPETKLVLLLALSSLTLHVHSQSDYLWMVEQWPPAVCSGINCVQPIPQIFTIHGLWPQTYTYPSPVNCSGPAYNKNLITGSLRTNLNTYWRDVIRGQNENFWALEWKKHGTCGVFGQVAYFNTAVQMRVQYDLKASLARANITPTNRTWTLASIRSAIQATTSKNPAIRCDISTRSKLLEIVLCYNNNGTAVINCSTGNRCNANVIW